MARCEPWKMSVLGILDLVIVMLWNGPAVATMAGSHRKACTQQPVAADPIAQVLHMQAVWCITRNSIEVVVRQLVLPCVRPAPDSSSWATQLLRGRCVFNSAGFTDARLRSSALQDVQLERWVQGITYQSAGGVASAMRVASVGQGCPAPGVLAADTARATVLRRSPSAGRTSVECLGSWSCPPSNQLAQIMSPGSVSLAGHDAFLPAAKPQLV